MPRQTRFTAVFHGRKRGVKSAMAWRRMWGPGGRGRQGGGGGKKGGGGGGRRRERGGRRGGDRGRGQKGGRRRAGGGGAQARSAARARRCRAGRTASATRASNRHRPSSARIGACAGNGRGTVARRPRPRSRGSACGRRGRRKPELDPSPIAELDEKVADRRLSVGHSTARTWRRPSQLMPMAISTRDE